MKKLKTITVFGTRPESIKMAPLVKELNKYEEFENLVCVTAQHREMLDQVLSLFKITPDFDLNIMGSRQTLIDITTKALHGLNDIFQKEKPDIVLVHGDTTTTFVGSLAAFYNQISVGHVEAGLRTFDKYSPFPEEINRKLTGSIADLHFAPTQTNRNNLLNENTKDNSIFVTGNTVIDALKTTVMTNYSFIDKSFSNIDFKSKRIITVTAHRRENLGEPLVNICKSLLNIVNAHEDVEIVYPVHLNPAVKDVAHEILGNNKKIHLINPLDVGDMHNLMAKSYMIMTDSGGIQEEAPSLGKPVLVLRNETERPEAVDAGTVKIAGTLEDNITTLANELLDDKSQYDKMARAINPYGDGFASRRIAKSLLYKYGFITELPENFK